MFMALALAESRADCDMAMAASVALLPMPQPATTSESMASDDSTPKTFFIVSSWMASPVPAGRSIVHDGPGTERPGTVEDGAGDGKPQARLSANARHSQAFGSAPGSARGPRPRGMPHARPAFVW